MSQPFTLIIILLFYRYFCRRADNEASTTSKKEAETQNLKIIAINSKSLFCNNNIFYSRRFCIHILQVI